MKPDLDKTLQNKAVQLLAQRNHSTLELEQKLYQFALTQQRIEFAKCQKDQQLNSDALLEEENTLLPHVYAQIQAVIKYCVEQRWLNEADYINQYIDMRVRKGCGYNRIIGELNQKGLTKHDVSIILNQKNVDWIELGLQQAKRKYSRVDSRDQKQKMTIMHFLSYRGFRQDEIRMIYSQLCEATI